MAEEPAVSLSIVVGDDSGWPEIEPNSHSFRAAAERGGGEVIVADGSGEPAPPTDAFAPRTKWIAAPQNERLPASPGAAMINTRKGSARQIITAAPAIAWLLYA